MKIYLTFTIEIRLPWYILRKMFSRNRFPTFHESFKRTYTLFVFSSIRIHISFCLSQKTNSCLHFCRPAATAHWIFPRSIHQVVSEVNVSVNLFFRYKAEIANNSKFLFSISLFSKILKLFHMEDKDFHCLSKFCSFKWEKSAFSFWS